MIPTNNYKSWRKAYFNYLLDMYGIIETSFKNDINIMWNSPHIFNDFCFFMYKNSSKKIESNLEETSPAYYDFLQWMN